MELNKNIGIPDHEKSGLVKFIFSWEFILLLIFFIIQFVNASLSPNYLSLGSINTALMNFLDKCFMIFPMTMILLLGEIDISVGSNIALSAVSLGLTFQATGSMPLAILVCLLVATTCGAVNGLIINFFPELPTMIITLSTLTFYRGLAYILLENKSVSGFPMWYQSLGWGAIGPVPIILIAFILIAILFSCLLYKSSFGREIYAMGNNKRASFFSGIRTKKNILFIYMLMGLMAGVTALFLSSRMSSVRADVATGYELEVIAMCVLGGVSTSGGKGKMLGPIIAALVIGFLRYGLGIINLRAQTITMIIGVLLIVSVLITRVDLNKFKNKFFGK
ncbi:ABC transporter permease [Enterococcus asini]|uniref:ABC transporter permease n=1 Tax=Enterococcus asini TaxID=57732 RepID=UPI000E4ECC6D|nr:ABC transporter permease [Enterococcus asini]RGW13381.1 ABC transporter permease [Enterococcus asini]